MYVHACIVAHIHIIHVYESILYLSLHIGYSHTDTQIKLIIHPSIHRSVGSAPVGVQCLLTRWVSRLMGWPWYPELLPVLVSIAFPFAFHYIGVFQFILLLLPLDFIRVFSLRPTYLHSFSRPFTYSLVRWVSRLGTGSGTQSYGPRGGTKVQKSRSKFLP